MNARTCLEVPKNITKYLNIFVFTLQLKIHASQILKLNYESYLAKEEDCLKKFYTGFMRGSSAAAIPLGNVPVGSKALETIE